MFQSFESPQLSAHLKPCEGFLVPRQQILGDSTHQLGLE